MKNHSPGAVFTPYRGCGILFSALLQFNGGSLGRRGGNAVFQSREQSRLFFSASASERFVLCLPLVFQPALKNFEEPGGSEKRAAARPQDAGRPPPAKDENADAVRFSPRTAHSPLAFRGITS